MSTKNNGTNEMYSEYQRIPDSIADALRESEWRLDYVEVGKNEEPYSMSWGDKHEGYNFVYDNADKTRSMIANIDYFDKQDSYSYTVHHTIDERQEHIDNYYNRSEWLNGIVKSLNKIIDQDNIDHNELPDQISDVLKTSEWKLRQHYKHNESYKLTYNDDSKIIVAKDVSHTGCEKYEINIHNILTHIESESYNDRSDWLSDLQDYMIDIPEE